MPNALFTVPTADGSTAIDHVIAAAKAMMNAEYGLMCMMRGEEVVVALGDNRHLVPKDHSITRRLIEAGPDAVMVIQDARQIGYLKDHPLISGTPGARSGVMATVCRDGQPVGALGVFDGNLRPDPTAVQLAGLKALAKAAGDLIDQAERRAAKAEKLKTLELAEAVAGFGHWSFDVATDRITWSMEAYRIHGQDPHKFIPSPRRLRAFYDPEDHADLSRMFLQTTITGENASCDVRMRRPDGGARLLRFSSTCTLDENNKVIGLFGVVQDVTEPAAAAARLAESEVKFRDLAEQSADMIAQYTLDGVLTYMSPASKSVLGHAPEDVIGRQVDDFIHADDIDACKAMLMQNLCADESTPFRMEYRAYHADGSLRWLEAAPQPVCNSSGQIIAIRDHVRDITERKRLEEALIEARDQAEGAARTKAEFLANMSHELRTPLTSVVGFSGLLQQSENLPEVERKHVERIATASEALLAVINDILDYSKLEAGAVEMDRVPFNPHDLIEGNAVMIEHQCEAKGLRLEVVIDEALPRSLLGDEGRLGQVMLNFLANAVKFTSTGAVRVQADWRDGVLRVAVSDTGIGIAPEAMRGLFERFTQADASTTRVYGGTGLGLAISRRLIEAMRGRIGADSRLGEGSTFWFEVPLSQAAAAAAAAPAAETEAAQPRGRRILMADDAEANRELLTAILGGVGVDLDTVANGAEALEAARTGAHDLILMDLHMPVMDGLEATRRIRQLPGAVARIPIIALSANVQPEQVAECHRAGMNAHVGKPIQVRELLRVMAEVLNSEGAGAAAA